MKRRNTVPKSCYLFLTSGVSVFSFHRVPGFSALGAWFTRNSQHETDASKLHYACAGPVSWDAWHSTTPAPYILMLRGNCEMSLDWCPDPDDNLRPDAMLRRRKLSFEQEREKLWVNRGAGRERGRNQELLRSCSLELFDCLTHQYQWGNAVLIH